MKTTDFSNASAAFVDMNQLLNVEKKYADLFRKRKNKANAKGRMRRVQTILVECNGRTLAKQIIHYRFCQVMKMWIAKHERQSYLVLFKEKPVKRFDKFTRGWWWESENMCNSYMTLDSSAFPEVTFENSPMEVELVIKK